jgi:hypothetical protein
MKEQDIMQMSRLYDEGDKVRLFGYIRNLKGRVSLDVAEAYNRGVEVGRKEERKR